MSFMEQVMRVEEQMPTLGIPVDWTQPCILIPDFPEKNRPRYKLQSTWPDAD